MKKGLMLAAALAMALMLPLRARAAEETGSLRLDILIEDLAVTRGAVTLYRVGFPVQEGYRIVESFGGGIVQSADAESPHLAQWLTQSAGEGGTVRLLDADGDAVFSGLEDGLYLMVQTEPMDGFYSVSPQLVMLPRADDWDVTVELLPVPIVAENPSTGEGAQVLLGLAGMMGSGLGLAICARKRNKIMQCS